MVYGRRRGTAIVDTPNGILVVSLDGSNFTLPGGGALRDGSRREAAIPKLMEETGMKAVDLTPFRIHGWMHRGPRRGIFRNAHRVFLVTATGTSEPGQEVKRVAYDGLGPSLTLLRRKSSRSTSQ